MDRSGAELLQDSPERPTDGAIVSLARVEQRRSVTEPRHVVRHLRVSPNSHIADISGITEKTAEVLTMEGRVAEGIPAEAYELVQGQVDHGRGHVPSPRIVFLSSDGTEFIFAGTAGFLHGDVDSVEFRNAGPGLHPENCLTFESDKTDVVERGEIPLGQHGRGISVALTELLKQGMEVDVASNHEGRPWRGGLSLQSQEEGRSRRLALDGEWDRGSSFGTVFAIHHPTRAFLERLSHLAACFLYANPSYPRAVIVDRSSMAMADVPLKAEFCGGRVECLDGIVSWDPQGEDMVFVGGWKVNGRTHGDGPQYLFPWHFEGFDQRDTPDRLRVGRSHDSSRMTGDPQQAIAIALRHSHNRELLERLLDAAVAAGSDPELDLPRELCPIYSWWGIPKELQGMSPETTAILQAIWREKYGDDLVTDDKWLFDKMQGDPNRRVVLVRGAIFAWLVEVGIVDAKKLAGLKREKADGTVQIDYAKGPDCLVRLVTEAVDNGGVVRVAEVGGIKVLQVIFPGGIFAESDLSNWQQKGGGWVKLAAVVAHEQGLNLTAISHEPRRRAEIGFKVQPNRWGGDYWLSAAIETAVTGDEVLQDSFLVVTLGGMALQEMRPGPDELSAMAVARLADREARRVAVMPLVPAQVTSVHEEGRAELRRDGERARRELEEERQVQEGKLQQRQDSLDSIGLELDQREGQVEQRLREAEQAEERARANLERLQASLASMRSALSYAGWTLVQVSALGLGGAAIGWALDEAGYLHYLGDTVSLEIPFADVSWSSGNGLGFARSHLESRFIVHEIDFRADHGSGSTMNPFLSLEMGGREQSPFGHYRTFAASTMAVERMGDQRAILAHVDRYEPITLPQTAPAEFWTSSRFALEDGTLIPPVREGHEIIAVVADGGEPVTVYHDQLTLSYKIVGETQAVTIYTAPRGLAVFNDRPPGDEEKESLVRVEDLLPHWQGLIEAVNANPGLDLSERAAIMIYAWSNWKQYGDDVALDGQAHGWDAEEAAARIVNTPHGPCNAFAAGLVVLLREVGVPARYVSGLRLQDRDHDLVFDPNESGAHAYTERWNETSWIVDEPQTKGFNSHLLTAEQLRASLTDPMAIATNERLFTTLRVVLDHPEEVDWSRRIPAAKVVVPALGSATVPVGMGRQALELGAALLAGFFAAVSLRKRRQK